MFCTKIITAYIDCRMRIEIALIKILKKDLNALKKFMDLD